MPIPDQVYLCYIFGLVRTWITVRKYCTNLTKNLYHLVSWTSHKYIFKTVTDIFQKLYHLVAKTIHITTTRIYNVPSKPFSP
jgi:hypothetical protein